MLFICILAVRLLGEPIDLARGLAVVAGLAGVAVVLRPGVMRLPWSHLSALTGVMALETFAASFCIVRA